MKKILILLIAVVTATIATITFAKPRVWVFLSDGTQITVDATNFDSVSFVPPMEKVTDVCSNSYHVVKIGKQVWMAENLKCNKYDTNSEAYKASWLTNNTIPTSDTDVYTPYYTNASDKSKWNYYSKDHGVNLTDTQVAKLGYLYNWAAAVGVANGEKHTTSFTINRQGICPNGWHLPTKTEWQTLYDYIYSAQKLTSNTVGKHLKTTSGWYNGDSDYKPGLDTYGFAALPSGYARGCNVYYIGERNFFLTVTPSESIGSDTYYLYSYYNRNDLYNDYGSTNNALSVRCLRDGSITILPTSTDIAYSGGTVTLNVVSDMSWSVSSNQQWATVSPMSGNGNAQVTITIQENSSTLADKAAITFTTDDGTATAVINRSAVTPVTDVCDNTYPVVKIGNQYWMTENLRCNKYDTKSEAYQATWLTNSTIPTASEYYVYTPCYTDASDKNNWDSDSKTISGVYLTDAQVAKLGYLYNWAAVVGVKDGRTQTTDFSGKRQGICPNEWHVPSREEWQTLYDYIYNEQKLSSDEVGKYLKNTSGWYSRDPYYEPGLDTYEFSVLPAGKEVSNSVNSVGKNGIFWSATPHYKNSDSAYHRSAYYLVNSLFEDNGQKHSLQSVRCLKN